MDDVLKLLGEVVAAGGSSALVAYGVFRWLGQKWLEQRLSLQLEGFKAERQFAVCLDRARLGRLRVPRALNFAGAILADNWFLDCDESCCHDNRTEVQSDESDSVHSSPTAGQEKVL